MNVGATHPNFGFKGLSRALMNLRQTCSDFIPEKLCFVNEIEISAESKIDEIKRLLDEKFTERFGSSLLFIIYLT